MKREEGFEGQRSCILSSESINQVTSYPHCQGLHITDIGYYPNARFHFRERPRGSSECILIYCTRGAGWYQVGLNKHEMTANQAVILPAWVPHQYGTEPANPWSIYWLHFAGSQAASFQQYLHNGDSGPLTIAPNEVRLQLFDDIFSHLTMAFNADNLLYATSCLPHFLATFRESVYKQAVQDNAGDVVNTSINYMKQHLHQSLALTKLAEQAGLSPSHYSALFRQQTQSSPIHFFSFLRMQQACRLLENTSLRIKEISDRLGFADPYHFSRMFRQFAGQSPRQYRAAEKG
ncbi:AraC family transcriptional regulator [Fibrella aquatilis]|uniref:AraC family transcriptional regulator n=1 Tax=Fibrella aquatilis TaxID=2817059 RepID=A0A939JZY7_9BACT|nr:AraC family transcriptional regulator [Fibrella aquatilis]MBO0931913.1 AraC family transcriptional regulator [Fibrella aquatilis]